MVRVHAPSECMCRAASNFLTSRWLVSCGQPCTYVDWPLCPASADCGVEATFRASDTWSIFSSSPGATRPIFLAAFNALLASVRVCPAACRIVGFWGAQALHLQAIHLGELQKVLFMTTVALDLKDVL